MSLLGSGAGAVKGRIHGEDEGEVEEEVKESRERLAVWHNERGGSVTRVLAETPITSQSSCDRRPRRLVSTSGSVSLDSGKSCMFMRS